VQARREAQAADVVVVNHHLLMADLVLKDEGFGDLLPGADAIVIDEAHQLPEIAANFLGFAVSSRNCKRCRATSRRSCFCRARVRKCRRPSRRRWSVICTTCRTR
jgi:Rad3-related DNA helicase